MKINSQGKIVKVSGPLVIAEGMRDAELFDVVRVSDKNLIGEVIEMHGDRASIQVYEETAGLGPGEKVVSEGAPLSVELAPGLIGGIYDGIQRPLARMVELAGNSIARGIAVTALDKDKKWTFSPSVKAGQFVQAGDILGEVQETPLVKHFILLPYGLSGTVQSIETGDFNVTETICVVKDDKAQTHQVPMLQKWPVRKARPYHEKIAPDQPLITGQRCIDTFFPVARGGTATIPGPFGSGKTVVQHQLAKWAEADIVVYIGCGERGNEMTDVLNEFPELIDPKSGESLMKRTILIANTSDMPVAAREASIYTGITIAEYFRDMGYSVSIMADSTSRWAEALREMSGRLEEMPGEEGYPAYLGSRLANFYERAGAVRCLGQEKRIGVLTAIGAVSPPGGDLSDPVAQSTLRIVKVFWGLDSALAYKRHFPAINWLNSYSLYSDMIDDWKVKNVASDWKNLRMDAMRLLQEEAELEEIVRLVGQDALSSADRLKLESAKMLREDYLYQDQLDVIDTYASPNKQYRMLRTIMSYFYSCTKALEMSVSFRDLMKMTVPEKIGRMNMVPEDEIVDYTDEISKALADQIQKIQPQGVR